MVKPRMRRVGRLWRAELGGHVTFAIDPVWAYARILELARRGW